MAKRFDVKQLNNITEELSQAMEKSRTQVFRFNEVALQELPEIENNLQEIKNEIRTTSIQCNLLKSKFVASRFSFSKAFLRSKLKIHFDAVLESCNKFSNMWYNSAFNAISKNGSNCVLSSSIDFIAFSIL